MTGFLLSIVVLLVGVVVALVVRAIGAFLGRLFGGGRPVPPPLPENRVIMVDRRHALAAITHQIEYWHTSGVLDPGTRARLLEVVEAAQRHPADARGPGAAPAAPPVPVVAAEAVPPPAAPVAAAPVRHTPAVPQRPAGQPPAVRPMPAIPPPPAPAPERPRQPPRKPLAELLAAFLEEKHIRWGELVGGMLVVGCSVALAVSFWTQIAEFKFYLFTAVTAAFFGIGFYAGRHWKAPTTTSGILLVATLLVPLNFLAIAAFARGTATLDPLAILHELGALVLFGWLVWRAAGVLAPSWPSQLAAGVMGASAVQLVVRRMAPAAADTPVLWVLGLAVLAVYAVPAGLALRQARRAGACDPAGIDALLGLLGVLTFCVLLPAGLLVHATGDPVRALRQLAPVFCLGGTPALAIGLQIWQRATDRELAGRRTAGTAAAAAGALLMVACTALAWPHPPAVVLVALADFAALTAVAWVFGIPAAHLLAVPCLALAYLVGFHVIAGHVRWGGETSERLADAVLSAASGAALVPLAVLVACGAAWLARAGRVAHGAYLAGAAAAVAAASVVLATAFAFGRAGDPGGATWVYAVNAVAALAVAWRWRHEAAAWIGSGLMLAAFVQAFVFLPVPALASGWRIALLAHASVATALAWSGRSFARPMVGSALAGSLVAALLVAAGTATTTAALLAVQALWLAVVWLALAWLGGWPVLFSAFQGALAAAVAFGAGAAIEGRPWFVAAPDPWAEPRTIQTVGIALALLNGVWVVVRIVLRRTGTSPKALTLLNPPWPTPDRVLGWVVLGAAAWLAVGATGPGVVRELAALGGPAAGGPEAGHALGAGSWVLLGLAAAVLAARLWETFAKRLVLACVAAVFIAAWLGAGRFAADLAATAALRWLLAAALVAGSCVVWFRGPLARVAGRWGWSGMGGRVAGLAGHLRILLLWLGVVPVVALSLPVGLGHGPASSAFSCSLPLAVVSLVLAGHGLRERSGRWASAGGLVLNLAVSLGWLLARRDAFGMTGAADWVRLVQLNALIFAGVALAWLGVRAFAPRRGDESTSQAGNDLLDVQVGLAVLANAIPLVLAGFLLFLHPARPALWVVEWGRVWGWLALGAAAVAATWWWNPRGEARRVLPVGAALLGAAFLIACSAAGQDTGNWLAFHTWLVALAGAAWAMVPVAAHPGLRAEAEWWARLPGALLVVVALRGLEGDPARPWWSMVALVVAGGLAAALAATTRKRSYLYAAGPLLNVAATAAYVINLPPVPLTDLAGINVLALALPGLAWLALELRLFSREAPERPPALPPFHHVAALGSVLALAVATALGLQADAVGGALHSDVLVGWLAWGAAVLLMAACLWDARATYAVGGLYALGLVGAGLVLDQCDPDPGWLLWGGVMAGGAHTLATGALWRARPAIAAWAATHGMPPRRGGADWLAAANLALAFLVVGLAFVVVATSAQLALRLTAATMALAQVPALGMLAQGEHRVRLQQSALVFGILGAVAWGWSWMDPRAGHSALDRTVAVLAALAAATLLYGAAAARLRRTGNDWSEALRGMVKPMMGLVLATLGLILAAEVVCQASGGTVPMAWPAVLAVALALVAGIPACLAFALAPKCDPLALSERGRMAYVYAAEGLVALVLVHLRLTTPWLFQFAFLQRSWPLLVMALAFLGVGAGEVLRRQNRLMLAEPLERTGAFLPLLPVLGFWVAEPAMHYSVLLLLAGALYGGLSMLRRSFVFGVVAALAANGSLWYLFHRTEGFGFRQHPQFWLVPLSLSVLVAAWLNRDRLTPRQTTTVRYLAGMTLYVSSTADLFLNGVAAAPWLPLVLAGLSIVGIVAGMAMRVRAFLFLGASFLALALLSMVWHAAVDLRQTWVWYVSGIVLGVFLIAFFAVFESKRAEVLQVVERLRRWEK